MGRGTRYHIARRGDCALCREYIAELAGSGNQSSTVWGHARAVKTMLRFWHKEGYIQTPVKFELPRIAKKRLPVLNAEQLKQIVKACDVRERAIDLFMAAMELIRFSGSSAIFVLNHGG